MPSLIVSSAKTTLYPMIDIPGSNAEKVGLRRTIFEKERKYGGKKGNLNVGKM